LKIVRFLIDPDKCVCEIVLHVKKTQSTVSIQLAKIENMGILSSRREGKSVYYKLKNNKVREILNYLDKNERGNEK
jgi:DNA-binding transcriptional ArsR family regulator